MRSVLEAFLGTFTSRYSDLRGYWLIGQLPFHSFGLCVDLMATPPSENTPEAAAIRIAVRRFEEQLAKSGLDVALVRSTDLKIHMDPKARCPTPTL